MKFTNPIVFARLASGALTADLPTTIGPQDANYTAGNLTNIRTYTALGDSFAAGIGT